MSVQPQGSTSREPTVCAFAPGAVGPAEGRHTAAGGAVVGPEATGRAFFENPHIPKWEPRAPQGPLVTSRNNYHPPVLSDEQVQVWEPLRNYVTACGKGTLALHYPGGRTVYGALMCGSWNCVSCRKRLAARQLDRVRRGMESRATWQRTFVTLTMDPKKYGAVIIGSTQQADGRWTNLLSEPSRAQFRRATMDMSKEWKKLWRRLSSKAKRAGMTVGEYYRVVELQRNAWPHYHVAFEHPVWTAEDIRAQVEGWGIGRVDLRPISLDDAVAELAPYLVANERKSAGSKAYQFAAAALPKGFRLHSSTHSFLGEVEEPTERPDYHLVLKGHFSEYHRTLQELGADARLLLHAPTDGEHRPPSRTVAVGDAAIVYFTELIGAPGLHLDLVTDQAQRLMRGERDGEGLS